MPDSFLRKIHTRDVGIFTVLAVLSYSSQLRLICVVTSALDMRIYVNRPTEKTRTRESEGPNMLNQMPTDLFHAP